MKTRTATALVCGLLFVSGCAARQPSAPVEATTVVPSPVTTTSQAEAKAQRAEAAAEKLNAEADKLEETARKLDALAEKLKVQQEAGSGKSKKH